MAIEVQCACGKTYKLPDTKAGKRVRCKACKEPIEVPDLEAKATASAADAESPVDREARRAAATPGRKAAPPAAPPPPRLAKPDFEVAPYNPDDLLTTFTKSRLVMAFLMTIVLHVLLIGGTSPGFIYDTYIDPEGAEARRKAAEEEKKSEMEEKADKVKEAIAEKEGEEGAADGGDGESAEDTEGGDGDETADAEKAGEEGKKESAYIKNLEKMREEHGDSETVRDITEMPEEGETPETPERDDLGLDLDSTNVGM